MNGRQAAKEAAKKIEELEVYNKRASADIKQYNECIISLINGGNPCEYCEEQRLNECEHPDLIGKGCDGWWLRFPDEPDEVEVISDDESQGILSASPTCGE